MSTKLYVILIINVCAAAMLAFLTLCAISDFDNLGIVLMSLLFIVISINGVLSLAELSTKVDTTKKEESLFCKHDGGD